MKIFFDEYSLTTIEGKYDILFFLLKIFYMT